MSMILVYALTQFVAQFLQAAYQILQGVTSMAGLNDVRKASQLSYPYINNLFCLSGPISVLVTRYVGNYHRVTVSHAIFLL